MWRMLAPWGSSATSGPSILSHVWGTQVIEIQQDYRNKAYKLRYNQYQVLGNKSLVHSRNVKLCLESNSTVLGVIYQ